MEQGSVPPGGASSGNAQSGGERLVTITGGQKNVAMAVQLLYQVRIKLIFVRSFGLYTYLEPGLTNTDLSPPIQRLETERQRVQSKTAPA